ncbi:MAG: hypothetical protein PHU23_09125 [Dehalococcoidales bacterium]|nr:hypothetical protein [Dehalococcoidales bacterium]
MFLTPANEQLRQGDILEPTWYTPTSFYKVTNDQFTVPQATIRRAYLVVISQCCELTWLKNNQGIDEPRRPFVLVAPLSFKMPFTKDSPEYNFLIENGINRPENDPIQFFYFNNNPVLGAESVVDFSTITAIRNGQLRQIGLKRLLELDVKNRHLFRTKLHEYFSRIPEEDWEQVKKLFPDDFKET